MNLRDLEYIVAVGKHRKFSYAAEVCHVSQPSLSAQVKKVEEELGIQIFERSKRKVEVTAYGSQFIERAEKILALLQEVRDLAHENASRIKGRITLGAILTVAPYMFSHIVKAVKALEPSIDLILREATTEVLIKELLLREIEMAVISLPTDDNVFESSLLFEEPFYLAVGKGHPLGDKEVVEDKDLKGRDLILLEEGHCFRKQALEICQTTTAKENKIFRATSLETIRDFVGTGEGITLMPKIAMKSNDGITYIPLSNPQFNRKIGLIWRKNSEKSVLIHRLIEIIRASTALYEPD